MDYESGNVKPQEITHVNEVCEKQVLGYLPFFLWGPLLQVMFLLLRSNCPFNSSSNI